MCGVPDCPVCGVGHPLIPVPLPEYPRCLYNQQEYDNYLANPDLKCTCCKRHWYRLGQTLVMRPDKKPCEAMPTAWNENYGQGGL
jgi:hypothetical protein